MSDERRRHERYTLQSQVAVTFVDVVHQLRVINVSRSGLFLEVDDFEEQSGTAHVDDAELMHHVDARDGNLAL